MKNLILFAALAFVMAGCGQKQHTSNATGYLFPYADSSFSWKKYEKQDSVVKQQFLRSYPAEFEHAYNAYFNSYTNLAESFKNLKAALHVMDVNSDGLNDIVFEGYSGGEPIMAAIYLNKGTAFKEVFNDIQTVSRMDFDNGKLSAIYITDPGCCA